MTDTQEHLNPSRNQPRPMFADWQFFCELGLPLDSDAEQTVAVWLAESLKRLDLPEDFVNKVLTSAQEAVTRLTRIESVLKIEHIHVSLFIPPAPIQESQSWGFFRAEKIMDTAGDATVHSQVIAIYLYVER